MVKYITRFNLENNYGEIFPLKDGMDHTGGGLCLCSPRIEHPCEGATLVIHVPQDGRHILEQAEDIINNHKLK